MVMPEPRLELKIGTPVITRDGLCGYVQHVILNPRVRRVIALVVRRGPLPPQAVVVPIARVTDATADAVRLQMSQAELAALPPFDSQDYVNIEVDGRYGAGEALAAVHGGTGSTEDRALVATHLSADQRHSSQAELPDQTLVLRAGQRVLCSDGNVGRVALLLLDSQGQVRHFVVRKGRFLGRDVIVPVDWITHIDRRGVRLAVERQALERLPAYRPDHELAAEVDRALWEDDLLRETDYDAIDIAVREGVVMLSGYVGSPVSKTRAEQLARAVPGVLAVENRLITDGEVVNAVAQALGNNSSTRGQPVHIYAQRGVVYLSGEVGDAAIRAAAEACAADIGLVRGIVNQIRAPGITPDSTDQRILQPQIDQPIYATDGYLGQVERVVISPRHRRVTAFVAHGHFPDTRYAPALPVGDAPILDRRVVIPTSAVNHVSESGVMLRINSIEAGRCPDFDPTAYIEPDPGWTPPYPYTHADVVFDLGHAAALRGDRQAARSGQVRDSYPQAVEELAWQHISRGMPVWSRDGLVGTVDHVWLDPRHGGVGQIVVRAGGPLYKDTLVPIDWVRRVDSEGVFVDVGTAQLAALPAYVPHQSDAALTEAARHRLSELPSTAQGDAGLTVQVQQGVARLVGTVPSDADRAAAEAVLRRQPGIWDLQSEVVSEQEPEQHTEPPSDSGVEADQPEADAVGR